MHHTRGLFCFQVPENVSNRNAPYIHQVPLDFIPGVGPKTIDRLIQAFGTEMAILHTTSLDELKEVIPEKLANLIDLARKGELGITVGGGGVYGKIDRG